MTGSSTKGNSFWKNLYSGVSFLLASKPSAMHGNRSNSIHEPNSDPDNEDVEMDLYLRVQSVIPIKMRTSEKISKLKAIYCSQNGVSENLQELYLSGQHLSDDTTMSQLQLRQNSSIDLIIDSPFSRTVFIMAPSRASKIVVMASAHDTIQYIKSIIEAQVKIPSKDFNLVHKGKLLENGNTLVSLNIESKSVLYLVHNPKDTFTISVKMPGEEVSLEVKLLYTINDVKSLVASMSGLESHCQKLMYCGKYLEGEKTLAYYDVKENSMLEVFAPFQVFVKTWSGRTITLFVESKDTPDDVNKKVYEKMGLPVRSHRLKLDGKFISGDLRSSNVRMHSTLVMSGP